MLWSLSVPPGQGVPRPFRVLCERAGCDAADRTARSPRFWAAQGFSPAIKPNYRAASAAEVRLRLRIRACLQKSVLSEIEGCRNSPANRTLSGAVSSCGADTPVRRLKRKDEKIVIPSVARNLLLPQTSGRSSCFCLCPQSVHLPLSTFGERTST